MKNLIKAAFLIAVLFAAVQIQAQTVVTSGSSLDELVNLAESNISVGVPVLKYASDFQFQDQYLQSFNYYKNPEISRLENEVQRHGNLYRRDQYGEKKYSATKYQGLTESEKKDFRSSASNFYRENSYAVFYQEKEKNNVEDKEKDKTPDQRAEEYFGRMIAPYLNSDGSINKQKLYEEIKKNLNTVFELKEAEKQKEVTKLENQLKALQATLAERKKNKPQIIEQKLNDLVGLPNNLRW